MSAGFIDVKGFGFHMVIFDPFDTNRLERAISDVKGYFNQIDATTFDYAQQLCREVQSGGRGGNGSAFSSEYGLIAFGIEAVLFVPLDVWRQGSPPNPIN